MAVRKQFGVDDDMTGAVPSMPTDDYALQKSKQPLLPERREFFEPLGPSQREYAMPQSVQQSPIRTSNLTQQMATPPPAPPGGDTSAVRQQMATPGGPQPFDRTAFRDSWMATGSDKAAQDALLAQYSLQLDPAGRVRLPSGELMDLRLGAKAGGTQATWTGEHQFGGGAGAGAPGAGGAGGPGGPSNPFQDQIRQIILAQLQNLQQPFDPNTDPEFQVGMGAANAQAQRVRQQAQKAAAERLAAQGYSVAGGGGALPEEVQALFEDQSYQLSGLAAQMVGRTLQDRRSQLQTLLNMAMQSGDAEAARATQLQMAAIDAELRRMGISENARQFDDEFGFRLNRAGEDDARYWSQFNAGLLG